MVHKNRKNFFFITELSTHSYYEGTLNENNIIIWFNTEYRFYSNYNNENFMDFFKIQIEKYQIL